MGSNRARFTVVVHLLVLAAERVLLLRRSDRVRAPGLWAPPGGHLEAGELPSHAAVRECLEETGVAVAPADLIPVATLAYQDGSEIGFNLLFMARLAAPVATRTDPAAASAADFLPLAQLPRPRVPWLEQALERAARLPLADLPQGRIQVPWYGEPLGSDR